MTSVLLGLETSGPVASAAISNGGRVLSRRTLVEQRRHASRLLPAVDEVLTEAGIARGDLTGVVVGTGPGSFTGVRVAAATGKGIAHALDIPLFAVSSLTSAAWAEMLPVEVWEGWPGVDGAGGGSVPGPEGSGDRVVLFDARGERLFQGVFRLGVDDLQVVRPPSFRHLSELLADGSLADALHCGSGAIQHAGALRAAGRTVVPGPAGLPSADGLLAPMASASAPAPVERPFDWEPDYLRETGATRGRGS